MEGRKERGGGWREERREGEDGGKKGERGERTEEGDTKAER